MTLALQFDFVPSSITFGEPFEVAAIIVDSDGEPQPEVSGIEARLKSNDGTIHKVVEVCDGEAIFSDVVIYPNFTESEPFALLAEGTDLSPTAAEEVELVGSRDMADYPDVSDGGESPGGGPPPAHEDPDEDTSDMLELVRRLKKATGANVKHYLMMIKGRMWGQDGNAAKMLESQAMKVVVDRLEICDEDEAIEVVALIQEFVTNPTGQKVFTCAACRAALRPPVGQGCFQTPAGLVFHQGCLLCAAPGCGKPIGAELMVRDNRLKPYHAANPSCLEAIQEVGGQQKDETPFSCTPLDLDSNANRGEEVNPALQHFFSGEGECRRFVSVLRAKHLKDEYVSERVKRFLVRVPEVFSQYFAELK